MSDEIDFDLFGMIAHRHTACRVGWRIDVQVCCRKMEEAISVLSCWCCLLFYESVIWISRLHRCFRILWDKAACGPGDSNPVKPPRVYWNICQPRSGQWEVDQILIIWCCHVSPCTDCGSHPVFECFGTVRVKRSRCATNTVTQALVVLCSCIKCFILHFYSICM